MSTFIRFLVFLILIAIVLFGFVFSNYNTIEVPLWLGVDFSPQRLGVWIIMAFSLGGGLGLILGFGLFKRIKYRVQLSQLKTKLKETKQELSRFKPDLLKGSK
jgi:uncharacterized integral membrane protein